MRCDPRGRQGPRLSTARGSSWRRTSQGFYVPADVDGSVPEQRTVEAAAVLPAVGAVTGWAALRWLGGLWFDGRTPDGSTERAVCLATDKVRVPSNAELSEERLPLKYLIETDGLMVVLPVWALAYEMRYAPSEREAAVAFDMAAFHDLVNLAEYDEVVAELPGWTGIPRMRKARPLLDENSWSPWETRMSHIWQIDAALPKPLANRPIFDRNGRHLITPDLLDPAAGLVGEYDGGLHATGSQRVRDRDRHEIFRSLGLEVVVMMSGDAGSRATVATRINEARSRARFEPEKARSWTIEPPEWWMPTTTVAQRRALDDVQRRRLLAHRAAA